MYETAAELSELQTLLDASIGRAGEHLRSIIEPGRRTMTAAQVVSSCADVCVLNLATVTAAGEPRLSGVDGHFLHGRWHFSTAVAAVKARHLRARPAASVAWTPADGVGVWAHGRVAFLAPDSDDWRRFDAHLARAYGMPPSDWPDGESIVYLRLDPHWMVGFAMTEAEQEEVQAAVQARAERFATPVTGVDL